MQATWRILDANFNRAAEGLRVVEDYLRFALNDRHLAERYKQLRHALNQLRAPWQSQLLAARDTPHDVGVDISTAQETTRVDALHVAAASQARAEQAIRCIEEYLKTATSERATAKDGEQADALRYELYTLGRAWQTTRSSQQQLAGRNLYALIDDCGSWNQLEQSAQAAIQGGVDILQWRAKSLDDRRLLEGARRLREVTARLDCLLIVNDRPDIAVLSGADGVHVGQDELPVHEARQLLGADRLVGVSTHSLAQAQQAVLDGADYIGCGPVFPSNTKAFDSHVGLPLLEAVAAEVGLPAFAIGGINAERVPQVLQAGFRRVAASHAVFGGAAPELAAREMKALLEQ